MKLDVLVPIGPSIAYIPLTNSRYVLLDAEDIHIANGTRWRVCGRGYVIRWSSGPHSTRRCSSLHRDLLQAPKGSTVDHVNGNRLDNRRANLRFASVSQNGQNRGRGSNNTSSCPNVFWDKDKQRWRLIFRANGKKRYFGNFVSRDDAISLRNEAARLAYGVFAREFDLTCPPNPELLMCDEDFDGAVL